MDCCFAVIPLLLCNTPRHTKYPKHPRTPTHHTHIHIGIGNTPFVSILRSLRTNAHRMHGMTSDIGGTPPSSLELSNASVVPDTSRLRRVYFHSCIPDQNALLWFSDVTSSLRDFPQKFLHVHIYLTQVTAVRSTAT